MRHSTHSCPSFSNSFHLLSCIPGSRPHFTARMNHIAFPPSFLRVLPWLLLPQNYTRPISYRLSSSLISEHNHGCEHDDQEDSRRESTLNELLLACAGFIKSHIRRSPSSISMLASSEYLGTQCSVLRVNVRCPKSGLDIQI